MAQSSQPPLRPSSLSIAHGAEQMMSLLQSEKARAIAEVNNQLSDLQRRYTELEHVSSQYRQVAVNSLADAHQRESNLHTLLAQMSAELEAVKGIITALGMHYEMNEQTGQRVLTCYDTWRTHLQENLVNGVTLNWVPTQNQPSGAPVSPPMSGGPHHANSADIAHMPSTFSH